MDLREAVFEMVWLVRRVGNKKVDGREKKPKKKKKKGEKKVERPG